MDAVVHSAIENICCEGAQGLHLRVLWLKLAPSLNSQCLPVCPNVKRAIWENLVRVPGLNFEGLISSEDLVKLTVQECEEMNVKVTAPEAMRKSFLGIYETEGSETLLSETQRRILERLAVARTSGVAQNDLTKELGIPANNLSYPLKRLETQGLIVRKPSIIRKKKATKGREPNNCSVVTTNMLYLHRYGEHLGCQQRLEITREHTNWRSPEVLEGDRNGGNDFNQAAGKEDVLVKDFLPAMKEICCKLENAKDNVLVVSDLKRDLGYQGKSGHRSWRYLCNRMKDAQLVEECCTMINKKEVPCIRLVQSFSPSYFESKNQDPDHCNDETNEPINLLKRGQITEQVVELPILRQIYDIIDAAGSRGLTNTEVCKRLGLCIKEYHKRYFQQMVARFGLYLQPEGQNRSEVYRVWTPNNYSPSCNTPMIDRGSVHQDSNDYNPLDMHGDTTVEHPQFIKSLDNSAIDFTPGSTIETEKNMVATDESVKGQTVHEKYNITSLCDLPDPVGVSSGDSFKVTTSMESYPQSGSQDLAAVTYSRKRANRKYPRFAVSAASILREQLIINILQEEKFLTSYELLRRLNEHDKEKNTTMDRKTLERILNKLQLEGHCKCMTVSIPADTNCSSNKTAYMVLLPSCRVSPELWYQFHEKIRLSSIQLRKQKKFKSTPPVGNVQRIPSTVRTDDKSTYLEALRVNGFVMGKMVRTKLFHLFLWDWIRSSPSLVDASLHSNNFSDWKNLHSSHMFFDLYTAIQSMPLELFLQIVGSTKNYGNAVSKYGDGLLLSSLPVEEYRSMMDTQATGRLSKLIYILLRLKLIRLGSNSDSDDGCHGLSTTLTYALEFKPYIEEPVSLIPSSCSFPVDLRPQVRHDFLLTSKMAVHEYWNTLEYCYAVAKPRSALLAFPGSAVCEVFRSKSWTPSLALTSELRGELIKRVAEYDLNTKLSLNECEKIAEDLNVTMEQILRVYYDKRQHTRLQRYGETKGQEFMTAICERKLSSHKRKRCSNKLILKRSSTSNCVDPLLGCEQNIDEDGSYLSGDFDLKLQSSEEGTSVLAFDREDEDTYRSNKKLSLSSMATMSKKKFFWTEECDRQLVIEYATQRAAHGPKFNCVNWASISNLPAAPAACKSRISLLNRHVPFRDSLMKLCNLLADQYAKHLEMSGEKILIHDGSQKRTGKHSAEDFRALIPMREKWANFEENAISVALNDVLRHKNMMDLESMHPGTGCKIRDSVAIANAMELFKLVFLSNKKDTELPVLLAKTLRHYAENDLYAAFDYLREKKMIIGGTSGSSFSLSRHFFDTISLSLLPKDTGTRAAKFDSWLHEREKDLIDEGIDVPSDIQCGEVFILCAMLCSGELSISPYLPDDGIGEAEDTRTSKRKCCTGEDDDQVSKRPRTSFPVEGEIISRREKGFPGIRLCLLFETISRSFAIKLFNHSSVGCASSLSGIDQMSPGPSLQLNSTSLCSDTTGCVVGFGNSANADLPEIVGESPWEKMSSYSEYLIASCSPKREEASLHPDLFRVLYSAIQRSGDNGLSFKEIQNVLQKCGMHPSSLTDAALLEIIVEVLGTFGRVLKVNAYDEFRVVDALYCSKYFLMHAHDQGNVIFTRLDGKVENEYRRTPDHDEIAAASENVNDADVHRITILNLSGSTQPESLVNDSTKGLQHSIADPLEINEVDNGEELLPNRKPLLPWVNKDGSSLYERLRCRVLGIVFQNPGILEDSIINQMQGLNPQSCRRLLETMTADSHIISRKMLQSTSSPPPLLHSLLGNSPRKTEFVTRVHYFPNLTTDTISLL